MFGFLKRKKKTNIIIEDAQQYDKKEDKTGVETAGYFSADKSIKEASQAAAQKYAKSSTYDRSLIDDAMAKKNAKINAFNSGVEVRDPYTGKILTLTKAEAKAKYGNNWTEHLAETDHIIPLKKRYEQTKNNPFLTTDDVKESSNSIYNQKVVSRKFNNAKRSRSNEDFVNDDEYLENIGIKLTDRGKQEAIENEKYAFKSMQQQDFKNSVKNAVETGHSAGIQTGKNVGELVAVVSSMDNIIAVINGEKTVSEACADVVVDGGKAVVTGYISGSSCTILNQTLSNSSSKFLQTLSDNNIPAKVVTSVMLTGDILCKWGNGEITTQECIVELGEKGLAIGTAGYSAAVGQALIPIPVVGCAVGLFVGSVLTGGVYNKLVSEMRARELANRERDRFIKECEKATARIREYRTELEIYLETYFEDYQDCFDEALSNIYSGFKSGNADTVIAGANQITKKLGGEVKYNNMEEFEDFLLDGSTDIL